jgi:hypothetical protein
MTRKRITEIEYQCLVCYSISVVPQYMERVKYPESCNCGNTKKTLFKRINCKFEEIIE